MKVSGPTRLLVLLGACLLFGRLAIASPPATQPTILADIVTYSLEAGQLSAHTHWQPAGGRGEANLKLSDVSGETKVENRACPGSDGVVVNSYHVTIQQGTQDLEFTYHLFVHPDVLRIDRIITRRVGNGVSLGFEITSCELAFTKSSVQLHLNTMKGEKPSDQTITEPSWAEFQKKHPKLVKQDIEPTLKALHLESLLSSPMSPPTR